MPTNKSGFCLSIKKQFLMMFIRFFCILFLSILAWSCNENKSVKELRDSLKDRELQIDSLARRLKEKEDSLLLLKKGMDTATISKDTLGVYKPELIGRWQVNMQCIETSCEGSAIGDVINEQWDISYEGSTLVAQVIRQNRISRTYKGIFKSEHIELKHEDNAQNTLMVITLQQGKDVNALEGTREIIRGEVCRSRYSVKLEKAQSSNK